jgi:hypothetical protein
MNTIAFAEADTRRMSRATSLVSVAQQLAISTGVIGALVVESVLRFDGTDPVGVHSAAFVIVACIAAASALIFARLPPDAGKELAAGTPSRLAPPRAEKPTDQPSTIVRTWCRNFPCVDQVVASIRRNGLIVTPTCDAVHGECDEKLVKKGHGNPPAAKSSASA